MNRRDYLRSLAIGSVGLSVAPLDTLADEKRKGADADPAVGEIHQGKTGTTPAGKADKLYLVADAEFIQAIRHRLPGNYVTVPVQTLDHDELVGHLANGNALVWVATPEHLPAALSVGGYALSGEALEISVKPDSPIEWQTPSFGKANAMGAYLAPPKGMPYHNIDEEVRADFLPILEAKDRFGEVVGYPGVYLNYYAPSLALGRFEGCECFFFFLQQPLQLMDADQWLAVFGKIDRKRRSYLQVTDFNTNYTAYHQQERVQVRTRLQNRNQHAVSAMLRFSIRYAGEPHFSPLGVLRRVPAGGSSTEAILDFQPRYQPGLCEVRMEVLQDVEKAELLAVDGDLEVVEARHMAFMIADTEVRTAVNHDVEGPRIQIEGKDAFWVGTHYYPSTSWWEWVWRDYRPLKAQEDFAAIRKAGYRIVRVWINPVIDEQVLRSVDVAIQQAAQQGIVVILTLFTQWIRQMGFQRDTGEQVLFDFRHPRDFNLISVSLRNLDMQREFISTLAKRWKHAGNLIYNLSNEVYIKDPDSTQMDEEVRSWAEATMEKGTLRDSLLFKRWANAMTETLRSAGAKQLVLPGYVFSTMDGGDVNIANADAPIVPWHNYYLAEHAGLKLHYFDPISSHKPILLEEFGYGEWNPTERYDGTVHYALAAGAAGAVSYEWGVSWLSRESCYWPLPMREVLVDDPDPRWFSPFREMAKLMSERGVGMCPTPSGTGYGSIYHGTPFPASAAVALGRLGLFGEGLQRGVANETTYVVIPKAQLQAIEVMDNTFKALWANNVLFGVWQEDDLSQLPKSARVVICPYPLSASSNAQIGRLKSSGVSVFTDDGWKQSRLLERVNVVAKENDVRLIARRTTSGTLLMAVAERPIGRIALAYQRKKVGFGLTDFGMAHLTDAGVQLVEGAGAIGIEGRPFCHIAEGRSIISAAQSDLLKASEIKLMVTQPTSLTFQRKIASVSISDGFGRKRAIAGASGDNVLQVDDQLARYVIHIAFVG